MYNSEGTEIIKANGTDTRINTGITTFTMTNNIYDLAGNMSEWTQEASQNRSRSYRGGNYRYSTGYERRVTQNSFNGPTYGYGETGGRPTLILNP